MTDHLTTLTDTLRELPGIGPRQARRLAHWLVRRDVAWVERLARTLTDARRTVGTCSYCMRLFPAPAEHTATLCAICRNAARDERLLLVVERDVDLENIERTGTYTGRYFVLGGTVSLLDKEPERLVRIGALERLLADPTCAVRELILALSATTEGEDTAAYLREHIEPLLAPRHVVLSTLARGLSTGTELEYVDADTMRNALTGRR